MVGGLIVKFQIGSLLCYVRKCISILMWDDTTIWYNKIHKPLALIPLLKWTNIGWQGCYSRLAACKDVTYIGIDPIDANCSWTIHWLTQWDIEPTFFIQQLQYHIIIISRQDIGMIWPQGKSLLAYYQFVEEPNDDMSYVHEWLSSA